MYPSSFALAVAAAVLLGSANSQSIIEIQTKTADDFASSMDVGQLDIEILNQDIDACIINNLSSGDNDFEADEVDSFIEDDLDGCLNFPLPNRVVESLTLTHDGFDDLELEWIRIFLDDSTFLQCNDGFELDGDESHILECGPYAP